MLLDLMFYLSDERWKDLTRSTRLPERRHRSNTLTRIRVITADTLSSRQRWQHDVDLGGRSGIVLAPAQSIRVQTKRGTPAASRLTCVGATSTPARPPPRVMHLTTLDIRPTKQRLGDTCLL